MTLQIAVDGKTQHDIVLTRSGHTATVWIDGTPFGTRMTPAGSRVQLTIDGRSESLWFVVDGDRVFLHAFGRAWTAEVTDSVERSMRAAEGSDTAVAPMPGVVVELSVQAGDDVVAGQQLAVIESMKMHTQITAWRHGRVERVMARVGDNFAQGAPLLALEPLEDEGEEETA